MHMWCKMVGNKNSGRKKDPLTEYSRMGKKTFYVRQTKNLKNEWVDDPVFQWFKRIHGSLWQKQIRAWMIADVKRVKQTKYWRCKCPNTGILGNYVPNRVVKCPRCFEWQNELTQLRYEQ